ncbi:MAG: recombinase family protein [Acidobacteriota bacterium]|nr:recombinase family protein [Acidobacteriota bacterium]
MTAAIYARVSTADQSCAIQLAELRSYAARFDMTCYKEYIDHGISGAKASRPQLDRMMQDARAKRFDVVLVSKLDRLGRSVLHLAQLMDTFNGLKIKVTACGQGLEFDPQNPISRMLFTMLSAVAEFERSLILERSSAGIAAARAKGVRFGPPMKVFDRELAARLRAEGKSWSAISAATGVAVSTLRENVPRAAG